METLWSLYDTHFAPNETEDLGRERETTEDVPEIHLAVVEKDGQLSRKEALRTSVPGAEGIEGLLPVDKMAKPGTT